MNEITFNKSEHIEEPIACITSTDELTASSMLLMSAFKQLKKAQYAQAQS